MEDIDTLTERPRPSTRRGAPARLLIVGDFVGELANEAAQAVRRAGLKPGLERSFGCDREQTGRVVGQEPEPGAELARNGQVILYVAAPAATAGDATGAEPRAGEQPEEEQPTRGLACAELASGPPRQRRKQGHSRSESAPDRAPAPLESGVSEPPVIEPSWEPDELVESDEEFVIAAEALFADGQGGTGRRLAMRNLRDRLGGRPLLLGAAIALLAMWLLIAGATALLGHSSSTAQRARPSAPATAPKPTEKRTTSPRPAQRAQHRTRAARRPRHRDLRRAPRRKAIALAPARPSAIFPAPPRAATSSPTPTPRHEGGPFSP